MNNEIQKYIAQIADGHDLSSEQASHAFQIMMNGGATPAQMAAIIMGLRMKGEAVSELTGAANTMRSKALQFNAPENAIDTCGTGGDAGSTTGHTLNISTAVALVAASCDVPVVKHGNRSVSSKSGSADVLEQLGVNLHASVNLMKRALDEAGICFLMAPNYHRAMRHIAPIRQELKLRTIFNLLGPLSNPAGVKRQLLGVYSPYLLRPIAEVLAQLGTEHAWVVHGSDGMDEISLTGPTMIAEVMDSNIHEFEIHPEDFGVELCNADDLRGGDPQHNAAVMKYLLGGADGPYRDIVALNTGAALFVAGKAGDLQTGVTMAIEALSAGTPLITLNKLIEITNLDEDD